MKKFLILATILIFLGSGALLAWVYWLVVIEPGEEIKPENIRQILGKESNVFFSDGNTKLGVFFDTAHRQYVVFEEIPKNFVNALIASEDETFFSHIGFDPIGISRAMIRNIQAGKMVQGGSTLTQQTAKNLFKRADRSLQSKIKELLFALRLEYHYPKEKILEFYANQFFVSGNGHGLGVAARYYFDKKPQDLTLAECAFIAGSVKRPNFYNPFIKKNQDAVNTAKAEGRARLVYVLGRMRDLALISDVEYQQATGVDVKFVQGKVGYALDYAMDMVREAVSSTEVLNSLEANDISNIATSGVKIITTVDRDLQSKTLAILRGELSRLDVRLRGYERKEVQEELAGLEYSGDSVLQTGEYIFGTIVDIAGQGKGIKITVDLDKKLGQGVINAEGLAEMVKARVKWQKNLWSEPVAGDQEQFASQLQKGDRVWVSVGICLPGQDIKLILERYPEVQGAAVILKDGAIRGMAGGTENRFFNRAVHAKRTMGSAFKSLVFTAALQLGWSNADLLNNSRNIFTLHGRPYFPRPDHKSPFDWVSMDWAGVQSENLATVWLLSHLCDQLSAAQFREVATYLGLAPKTIDRSEEPYRSFSARIRDRYGILVNRDILRAAAYRTALENLETDFIFEGLEDEHHLVKELPYGLNFDKFTEEVEEDRKHRDDESNKLEAEEVEMRKKVLSRRYLLLLARRDELAVYKSRFDNTPETMGDISPVIQNLSLPPAFLYNNKSTGTFSYISAGDAGAQLTRVDTEQLRDHLKDLQSKEREQFWKNIKINGLISVAALDKVEEQIDEEYAKLTSKPPYSFEVLSQIGDFRTTVGLHYVIELARQLGVKGALEPVLSFPLGSNVVTLLETTRMYEGLITGRITTFGEGEQEESNDSLAILARIESEDGRIVYQQKPNSRRVIDKKTTVAMGSILENVVKFGTGKTADTKVRLSVDDQGGGKENVNLNLPVPLLGKTGTANKYANASFFGYIPGVDEDGDAMVQDDGFAVGVYVGFDDNRPMRRKTSRISGAAGALPTWIEIANVLLREQKYATRLDPVDVSFYGLTLKRQTLGQVYVSVSPGQGGKVVEPSMFVSPTMRTQHAIHTFGKQSGEGKFEVERFFLPFWIASGTPELNVN